MMNELLIELTPYIVGILALILGYVSTLLKGYIDSKIDHEKQEQILTFVNATVAYVEQIGVDLKAEEKLELAKEKVIAWASEKGLAISELELQILIEAFVNGLGGK